MRKLVVGGALGVFLLAIVLAACSGSEADSIDAEAHRYQDMWEIGNIEKQFHQATSEKDIDMMLSLYAPNATFTVGGGETAVGIDEIREFWTKKSPRNERIRLALLARSRRQAGCLARRASIAS